jgi:hypothetical protein
MFCIPGKYIATKIKTLQQFQIVYCGNISALYQYMYFYLKMAFKKLKGA